MVKENAFRPKKPCGLVGLPESCLIERIVTSALKHLCQILCCLAVTNDV